MMQSKTDMYTRVAPPSIRRDLTQIRRPCASPHIGVLFPLEVGDIPDLRLRRFSPGRVGKPLEQQVDKVLPFRAGGHAEIVGPANVGLWRL